MRQEDGLVLELAVKELLRGVSVIRFSPLYDHSKSCLDIPDVDTDVALG